MRPFEHLFVSLFLSPSPPPSLSLFLVFLSTRLSRSCCGAQFLTPAHARVRVMKQSHLLHASLVSSSCNHDSPSISAWLMQSSNIIHRRIWTEPIESRLKYHPAGDRRIVRLIDQCSWRLMENGDTSEWKRCCVSFWKNEKYHRDIVKECTCFYTLLLILIIWLK